MPVRRSADRRHHFAADPVGKQIASDVAFAGWLTQRHDFRVIAAELRDKRRTASEPHAIKHTETIRRPAVNPKRKAAADAISQ
jgi:predicted thioesterase